jgi:hypothetical protein
MNTSKSLYEMLEHLVLISLEEGRNGDLAKQYHEYDGDMDWTAFVAKHFPLASETEAAIVEAVEGLIPKKVQAKNLPKYLQPAQGESWLGALRYEEGYNHAVADFLQAIKEWQ